MAWQRTGSIVWRQWDRAGGHGMLLSNFRVAAPCSALNVCSVRNKSDLTSAVADQAAQIPFSGATIFSDLTPVLAAQDALCQLHDVTGLMWAPTIVAVTFGVRLLVGMPITILQQKSIFRLEKLKPEIMKLQSDIMRESFIAKKTYNWDDRRTAAVSAQAFKKHFRSLVEQHNCHPFRGLALSLLQMPAWITLSSAIRNIAYQLPENLPGDQEYRFMQLLVENPLWIESLATPDPFILPAIFVAASLTNLNLHRANNLTVPQTKLKKALPYVFGTLIVGIGVIATYVPSAVSLYWATSGVSALAVTIFLRTPGVGTALGLKQKSSGILPLSQVKSRFSLKQLLSRT